MGSLRLSSVQRRGEESGSSIDELIHRSSTERADQTSGQVPPRSHLGLRLITATEDIHATVQIRAQAISADTHPTCHSVSAKSAIHAISIVGRLSVAWSSRPAMVRELQAWWRATWPGLGARRSERARSVPPLAHLTWGSGLLEHDGDVSQVKGFRYSWPPPSPLATGRLARCRV